MDKGNTGNLGLLTVTPPGDELKVGVTEINVDSVAHMVCPGY
jgi:hypothetical protein